MQFAFVYYEQPAIFSLNHEVWLLADRDSTHHLHDVVPHLNVWVLVQTMGQDAILDIGLLCRMNVAFYLFLQLIQYLLLGQSEGVSLMVKSSLKLW